MLSNKVKVIANACIKGVRKYNKEKPFKEQVSMSTKRLNKLLFLCEIEYMKHYDGNPLFEEKFYAWPSGPAIPAVYACYNLDCDELPTEGNPTSEEQEIIDKVLSLTMKLDTIDLNNACTTLGSPWIHVFDVDDENHGQKISKEETYWFYRKRDLKDDILKVKLEAKELKELVVPSPSELGICDGGNEEETCKKTPVIIVEN